MSLNYVIQDYVISYQPSAALMVRLNNQKTNKQTNKQLLAIAPFSNGDLKNTNRNSTLNNLPYTKKELENLEQLFTTDAWYQKEASKQFFLKEAKKYKMLHLATHGKQIIIIQQIQDYSFIQKIQIYQKITFYIIMKFKIYN